MDSPKELLYTRIEHQGSINSRFLLCQVYPPRMSLIAAFLYTSMCPHQIEQSMCLQVISNNFSSQDSSRRPRFLTLSLWGHVCSYTRQSIAVALAATAHEIPDTSGLVSSGIWSRVESSGPITHNNPIEMDLILTLGSPGRRTGPAAEAHAPSALSNTGTALIRMHVARAWQHWRSSIVPPHSRY